MKSGEILPLSIRKYLASDKYQITAGNLHLNNKENYQDYKILIIPGGSVIALNTLQKIKDFYDQGGKVIATTLLPSQSTDFGQDEKIVHLIQEIFGADAANHPQLQTNSKGGEALFVKNPNAENLSKTISGLYASADVSFENINKINSQLGLFSYLHKVKNGKDIYFFANYSDDKINTTVLLRGKHQLQSWDPNDGKKIKLKLKKIGYVTKNNQVYTKCELELAAVKSVFWIGKEVYK